MVLSEQPFKSEAESKEAFLLLGVDEPGPGDFGDVHSSLAMN